MLRMGGKAKQSKSVALNKLLNWHYQEEEELEEGITKQIYENYRTYFTEFKNEFENVKSISGQLEGVVEEIVDAAGSVR